MRIFYYLYVILSTVIAIIFLQKSLVNGFDAHYSNIAILLALSAFLVTAIDRYIRRVRRLKSKYPGLSLVRAELIDLAEDLSDEEIEQALKVLESKQKRKS